MFRSGELPIIGVDSFLNLEETPPERTELKLARSSEEEKNDEIRRLRDFQQRHAKDAPAALTRLKQAAMEDGNIFEALMDAVRVCSLGQITHALFEVGGQYRRSM